jgi:hypothetical protein
MNRIEDMLDIVCEDLGDRLEMTTVGSGAETDEITITIETDF